MTSTLILQQQLLAAGATVATAESLTGGLLGAAITATPGSSEVYVGGVVTYATELKMSLLSVPASVVSGPGVVSGECAEAMAAGVRELTGATYAVSTTGVAGPDAQEGKPVGTVFVGVAGPSAVSHVRLHLAGGRDDVRALTVAAAVSALSEQVSTDSGMCVGEETPLG
ncbi:Competence/damage-inducible protein cinA [metagenome]|uniref:Competence/damage-inducible protein cinA n=1 Tax=metagenome TaxID=256318 RepID=A0A2P2C161_9ZZZZ